MRVRISRHNEAAELRRAYRWYRNASMLFLGWTLWLVCHNLYTGVGVAENAMFTYLVSAVLDLKAEAYRIRAGD